MGRWTPLILMAGGLAILLGTLLGINFPMDGRNAEAPAKRRESQVLPANINVNSTATGANGSAGGSSSGQSGQQGSVAQNNNNSRTIQSAPTTTAQGNRSTTDSTSTAQPLGSNSRRTTSGNKAPIRALW
ncbi:hypothetical protein Riv7116_2357 [Rivularia sp. PCC 7116]|uniref:hypothetical protein n=1 Tax=Rivularia sp. PCC 7116 TaxID=373994 RepID=UPI00029EE88A|nr:hypothetical protein [Rivularia sp. PCC 7116]AFY54873.1 hypothetical protein Riv7116_2357 [Rivularia sp. PCC 7116]